MKKIIAVMLLIVLTMSLVACGGDKNENGSDLVKVGDTTISENELEQYLEFTAFIQGVDTSQFPEESMKAIKSQMLDDMVALECIKQKYSGKEKEVLPDTIEADLKSFMDEAKNTEAISSFLKENKISDETLKKFFYNQNYRTAYFQEVEAGMADLEKDAKAFYDANLDSFEVDEVAASHILVADEATAKDILAKLQAGEKFEDLAKQYGTDGTKDQGGSLGTFGRGEMVKEFEDVAFALKVGEISDVVKTEFGYHVIKVTDKNQGTKTYEEAKESIKTNLVSEEAQKQITDLKESTKVKYLTDEYTGTTEG